MVTHSCNLSPRKSLKAGRWGANDSLGYVVRPLFKISKQGQRESPVVKTLVAKPVPWSLFPGTHR